MAATANVCLFKDKECTQPLTLAELEEAYGKRQIIIREEYETDGGNIGFYYYSVVDISKEWNESVTPNIAYGKAHDIKQRIYLTSEYFGTTS